MIINKGRPASQNIKTFLEIIEFEGEIFERDRNNPFKQMGNYNAFIKALKNIQEEENLSIEAFFNMASQVNKQIESNKLREFLEQTYTSGQLKNLDRELDGNATEHFTKIMKKHYPKISEFFGKYRTERNQTQEESQEEDEEVEVTASMKTFLFVGLESDAEHKERLEGAKESLKQLLESIKNTKLDSTDKSKIQRQINFLQKDTIPKLTTRATYPAILEKPEFKSAISEMVDKINEEMKPYFRPIVPLTVDNAIKPVKKSGKTNIIFDSHYSFTRYKNLDGKSNETPTTFFTKFFKNNREIYAKLRPMGATLGGGDSIETKEQISYVYEFEDALTLGILMSTFDDLSKNSTLKFKNRISKLENKKESGDFDLHYFLDSKYSRLNRVASKVLQRSDNTNWLGDLKRESTYSISSKGDEVLYDLMSLLESVENIVLKGTTIPVSSQTESQKIISNGKDLSPIIVNEWFETNYSLTPKEIKFLIDGTGYEGSVPRREKDITSLLGYVPKKSKERIEEANKAKEDGKKPPKRKSLYELKNNMFRERVSSLTSDKKGKNRKALNQGFKAQIISRKNNRSNLGEEFLDSEDLFLGIELNKLKKFYESLDKSSEKDKPLVEFLDSLSFANGDKKSSISEVTVDIDSDYRMIRNDKPYPVLNYISELERLTGQEEKDEKLKYLQQSRKVRVSLDKTKQDDDIEYLKDMFKVFEDKYGNTFDALEKRLIKEYENSNQDVISPEYVFGFILKINQIVKITKVKVFIRRFKQAFEATIEDAEDTIKKIGAFDSAFKPLGDAIQEEFLKMGNEYLKDFLDSVSGESLKYLQELERATSSSSLIDIQLSMA